MATSLRTISRAGTGPQPSDGADPFRGLMPTISVICLLTHAAFLLLFGLTGVPVMVVTNVVSLTWFVWVFVLVRRGRTRSVVVFGMVAGEVVCHAFLATAVIGWGSGFHYYILLLVPVAAVSTLRPGWRKGAAVGSAGLAYFGLSVWQHSASAIDPLPDDTLAYLYYCNVLSTLVLLAVLAGRYYRLISATQAALQRLATTDPLTQLANRNSLTQTIESHHRRVSRGHSMALVICDIDHFKQINDRAGHNAGDAVLRSVSRAMATSIRDIDVIGRWGGEEFLVVLPDTDDADATLVAERLRRDVAALRIRFADQLLSVTVTIGVATVGAGESVDQAIGRADGALYSGKRSGRDRVVVASSAVPLEAA